MVFQSSPAPEGGCNYSGEGALTSAQKDAMVWRYAKAWQADDVQTLSDLLGDPEHNPIFRGMFNLSFDTPKHLAMQRHWFANTTVGKNFSDLLDAASSSRMRTGKWAHGETYYLNAGRSSRTDEAWANIISIMGSGDMGVELIAKATPSMLRTASSLLKRYAGP